MFNAPMCNPPPPSSQHHEQSQTFYDFKIQNFLTELVIKSNNIKPQTIEGEFNVNIYLSSDFLPHDRMRREKLRREKFKRCL